MVKETGQSQITGNPSRDRNLAEETGQNEGISARSSKCSKCGRNVVELWSNCGRILAKSGQNVVKRGPPRVNLPSHGSARETLAGAPGAASPASETSQRNWSKNKRYGSIYEGGLVGDGRHTRRCLACGRCWRQRRPAPPPSPPA